MQKRPTSNGLKDKPKNLTFLQSKELHCFKLKFSFFSPNFKYTYTKQNKTKKRGTINSSETIPYFAKYSNISLPEANPAPIIEPIITADVFSTFIKIMYERK